MELVVPGVFEITDDGETVTLVGDRCADCSRVQFPRRLACDACCSRNLESTLIGPTGILWSCSVDRLGMLFGSPYAVAQVQMDNGPVIQSYLVADFDALPAIGVEVEAVSRVLPGGDDRPPLLGFGFRVVGQRDA